jgi:F-type H+-transporting ATPase subunit alpha
LTRQFRELEAFAQMGTNSIPQPEADRPRTETLEVLKQGQYVPMDVTEQVAMIYAGTEGLLDKIAVADVKNFEEKFIQHLRASHRDVLDGINSTGELKDPQALKKIVGDYVEQYLGSK